MKKLLLSIITHPYRFNQLIKWSANRYLDNFLIRVSQTDLILDIGTGTDSVIPDTYHKITCDYSFAKTPNLVGNALHPPLKNSSVDHICCSWVLEHIEDPQKTIQEFYRILKPNGYLYLTTNFTWHIHEQPRDFFRFTHLGLQHLFKTYGEWNIIFLAPTASFWITMSQLLNYKLANLLKWAHPLLTVPLQLGGLLLEKLNKDDRITAGYCIIAQKK